MEDRIKEVESPEQRKQVLMREAQTSGLEFIEKQCMQLESSEERRTRLRSLRLLSIVTVLMCVAFSVTSNTVWPYLSQIDEDATKSDLGWVITVGPLGQLMSSTLMGYWANRRRSIKVPALISMAAMIVGNSLYSLLYAFRNRGDRLSYYMMIFSRFLVGISQAFYTLLLTYIGASTTVKERKFEVSKNASMRQLGYVMGPGITAVMTIVFPQAIYTNIYGLVIDENTASGWCAVSLCIISMIMIPFLKERNIALEEYKSLKKESLTSSREDKLPSPNKLAVTGINLMFVALMLVPSVRETLATPLVADQYGLSDSKVVFVTSLTVCVTNLLAAGILLGTAKLTSKMEDRKALLFCALLPLLLSIALHYPIGDTPIQYANCTSTDTTVMLIEINEENASPLHPLNHYSTTEKAPSNTSNIITVLPSFYMSIEDKEEEDGCYGCPLEEQPWCLTTPQITPPQLVVAYTLTRTSSTTAITFTQALYSKILGPNRQGLWMGILSSASAVARISGPLWISSLYEGYGTIYTYLALFLIETLGTLVVVAFYRYLVPMIVGNENKATSDDEDNSAD